MSFVTTVLYGTVRAHSTIFSTFNLLEIAVETRFILYYIVSLSQDYLTLKKFVNYSEVNNKFTDH